MSHLNGESLNIENKNIEKLVELFPEVNTDGKVDFEKLKQILGEYVDDSDERYRFVWNGKGEALRLSQTPSTGTLRPAKEESKNWDETENLYIEGDNLEVLKLLQKSYFNKVKMIYIDPPYNTGGDFVYKDNFKDNIQNYKKITGQVDSEGNATTTNREYSGRYHTDWLNMMYSRLRLARNLLKDDGVIFISIDDNEVTNLKKVCDEIFGEINFITQITVLCNPRGRSQDKYFATNHEYILVYSKSELPVGAFSIAKDESQIEKEYPEIDNKNNKYRLLELRNTHRDFGKHNRPNLYFPIYYHPESHRLSLENKQGYIAIYPIWNDGYKGCWTWDRKKVANDIEHLEVRKVNENWKVYRKNYAEGSVKMLKTIFTENSYFTDRGQAAISDLFDTRFKIFESPKSVSLIKQLIQTSSDNNDIILDFFAGSSTTAHAVMNLNIKDGGNRKFIMIQLPEETDEGSEASKAGYETIAELGKERIRRAGEKVKAELKEKYDSASEEEQKVMKHPDELDIGFKLFKLDSSNIKEWNPGKYENVQEAIEDALTPYVPSRTEEDVVYEMMLKMGLDLTYPVEEIDIKGKTIYSIGYGFLMICLADNIDIAVAEKMIEIKDENNQQEFRAIFRDEGFSSDTDKTNVKETLRSAGLAEESFITL
ncbi:site-specific DNA-methyltransferase [Amphibacillus indicireducens]|uniref:Site-specific DNA-methyltransferase n=1 Tax=Amphibacillus indicireducens TaxID=1076330 RepID=A0ABP7W1K8_9BACI